MSKILYLLPYSNDGNIHGGKIRAKWISKELLQIDESCEVVHVCDLNYEQGYSTYLNSKVPKELAGDLELLTRNYSLELLVGPKTELIVFEQPWLWNEVKRIKAKYPQIRIAYSSQNIEWRLKLQIFERYSSNYDHESLIGIIRNLEIDIAKNVDVIFTVSMEDLLWYQKYSKNEVTLAKNGTSIKNEETTSPENSLNNYGLIVGSAHPPNIEGVFTYLSDPNLWLPRGSSIKIVGSLANAVKPIWSGLLNRWGLPCIELIDSLSDQDLKEIIASSKVILLPISYGGGTNLKTAEALASKSYVVGSKSAFRGFEEYSNLEGVFEVKNSLEFKIRTIGCLNSSNSGIKTRQTHELNWDQTLAPVRARILELLNG